MMRSVLRLIVGLLCVLGVFVAGEYAQRLVAYQAGWAGAAPAGAAQHMALNMFQRLPHPLDKAKLLRSGLPVYELQIATKELRKLRRTADLVSAAKDSTQIPRDYVPASFLLGGKWCDIEVKLRGKTHAHYNRYRPSLRLKFPKNNLFAGKREVNLCRANDKGVTIDLTTNWELSRYGMVTWESQFVVLKVNDEVVGVFQEIEQFGRSMLDRAGRSEGFIFSGSGQLYGSENGFGWDKAEPAIRWFLACKDQADVPADAGSCTWPRMQDYLDTDKFAWATAQTTLLGSTHAWSFDNTRVYYDPARGKFEPIPWDYKCYPINPQVNPEGETCKFQGTAFLRIPEFRRMRDQRLWVLLNQRVEPMLEYADRLFADLDKPLRLDHRSPKFWREREIHESFRKNLERNSALLKSLYQAHDLRANVYRDEAGNLFIDLQNYGKAAVKVTGFVWQRNGQQTESPCEPVLVNGLWRGQAGRATLASAQLGSMLPSSTALPAQLSLVRILAENDVTGVGLAGDEVQIGSERPQSPPVLRRQAEPQSLELPAHVRLVEQELQFGPQPVSLDRTWEIPAQYAVRFLPGLQLSLADGASLIIYGDLTAEGTEQRPIRVFGVDSKHGWGALAVQGTRMTPRQVNLAHTSVIGGTGAENSRSHFTGAFSVTDGVVTLRNCSFVDAGGIDGINLKYCRVDLQDNTVRGSADDALDLDFCQGVVVGNHVLLSGGDGLDFSGSDLDVEQNLMEHCNDKGCSVGEHTLARLRNNIITHCRTGVASKDGSVVHIEHTGLAHLEIGIALYQKKLTFGLPTAHVRGVAMADVTTTFLQADYAALTVANSARYSFGSRPTTEFAGITTTTFPHPPSAEELRSLLLAGVNDLTQAGVRDHDRLPW